MMLEDIKAYLQVTWNDEDERITALINRGKAYLNEGTGAELDFETEGLARSLLFDYVRYAYNNASEYFAENFREDLRRLSLMVAVEKMQEASGDEA